MPTRRHLLQVSLTASTAALAACGTPTAREATVQSGPPRRIVLIKTSGAAQDDAWKAQFAQATKATNVTVDIEIEADAPNYYSKRVAEFAAGTSNFDLISNAANQVLPLGLKGLLADLNPMWKRDKWDASMYYKADLETWTWKTKLWAMPFQFGGETWMYNKQLFDAKGIRHPTKDWTYDDLLSICQKLNDPTNNVYAIQIGQNTIQYMFGTFLRNHGGKVLNDTRDKALYGDDASALRGAELNVDLHQKHKVAWTAALLKNVPANTTPMRSKQAALEVNGLGSYVTIAQSIGMQNLDFLPPPKGPTGIQTVRVAGNSWSIPAQSKNVDAAWTVLKYNHTKEGMLGPQLEAISWPPLIWAGTDPKWADRFKGTRIEDVRANWQKNGQNQVTGIPEGDPLLAEMNAPLTQALNGELSAREALRLSAEKANAGFAKRPTEWKL
ncbi:MAG TPA: extracellular solute-binding protein [Chloroflexota bacterium]|nr:extracellular solute-binding protein [Chloroflexota bacterium]